MRDVKRINPLLQKLEKIWLDNPDFRIGQLIIVITKTGEINPKLFYMEDDEFLEKMDDIEKQFAERKAKK